MPDWLRVMSAVLAIERADQNGSPPAGMRGAAGALTIADVTQPDCQDRLTRDRTTFDAYRVDLSADVLIVIERKARSTADHHRMGWCVSNSVHVSHAALFGSAIENVRHLTGAHPYRLPTRSPESSPRAIVI
jgi:hypothetical protein